MMLMVSYVLHADSGRWAGIPMHYLVTSPREPINLSRQVCVQLPASADNVTLPAFAAERRAAVFMDRKAAAPAADAPCSNRSISPACRAHSSKPAAAAAQDVTDGQRDTVSLHRPCRILCERSYPDVIYWHHTSISPCSGCIRVVHGMGWIGSDQNFSVSAGLGWVSQLTGWIGPGHTKWTHGQLWVAQLRPF